MVTLQRRRGKTYINPLPRYSSTPRYCYSCGLQYPTRTLRERKATHVPVGERFHYTYICEQCDIDADANYGARDAREV